MVCSRTHTRGRHTADKHTAAAPDDDDGDYKAWRCSATSPLDAGPQFSSAPRCNSHERSQEVQNGFGNHDGSFRDCMQVLYPRLCQCSGRRCSAYLPATTSASLHGCRGACPRQRRRTCRMRPVLSDASTARHGLPQARRLHSRSLWEAKVFGSPTREPLGSTETRTRHTSARPGRPRAASGGGLVAQRERWIKFDHSDGVPTRPRKVEATERTSLWLVLGRLLMQMATQARKTEDMPARA